MKTMSSRQRILAAVRGEPVDTVPTSDSMREGTPRANIDEYFRAGREFGKA